MLLTSTSVFGDTYPRGCEVTGFGYNEHYLILNEQGDQTFYLIQNRSDTKIELERHETEEVFMSPTLQAKLDPKQWAAFASDVGNLHFKCYQHSGNNTSLVKCSDVLDICQYPRVKFALSNMGNYWVSTNKPQAQVIKDAIAKGILLRW
nr:enhanced entry protein EnhB [Legionella yabuuchiae]